MNILFTNFHATDGGGHVTYILHLARALAEQHQISIATPSTSRLYRYAAELPGVTRLDQWYISRVQKMVPEVRQLRQRVRQGRYDIIHINGSADHRHVMLACMGLRKRPRLVWTKHNDHSVTSLGNHLRARWGSDHTIAVSQYVADHLRASPYVRKPMTVIRHGVDTDRLAPVSEQERAHWRELLLGPGHENMIVLGSSGGTDYDKGWLDLLTALSFLPDEQRCRFRVVVAGTLPDSARMARVAELGVKDLVVFPGLVDDIRPVLGACDVGFVLSYREALSYACREVMSLGLPALVTDVGGLPENVTPGINGWIVPARAPKRIQSVLASLLLDSGLARRLGQAARNTARQEFALPKFVAATQKVYEQVLSC